MNINEPAPQFELTDLEGGRHRLSDYRGMVVILDFWSCECPHSARTDAELLSLLDEWKGGAAALLIASNRGEDVEAMKISARERMLPVVLRDADSAIANLYEAQTTPHLFIIDREGILRYRGAVDDVTFRQRAASRSFLREAVEALLAGTLPAQQETPAYGCAIVREI